MKIKEREFYVAPKCEVCNFMRKKSILTKFSADLYVEELNDGGEWE